MPTYDLLIRGARVADGLGNPLTDADVAVKDGRIAAVGAAGDDAAETIDARGLVLAPGIVDVHTHYDAQITWDPTCAPSPALGVTTVVTGNCGFGIAPAPPERRETIMRNLSEVEAMPLAALEAGIAWDFESFADYLALVERRRPYPNIATFVGHSTVRSVVMGPEASQREATEEEIARMRAMVERALGEGAIGFASSHSQSHYGYGGVPMPSRLASDVELRGLVGTLAAAGRGLFQITVGPQDTVEYLESIAADTGRPVVFSALFDNEAFPERAPSFLDACAAAVERGRTVRAQIACQPLSMDFTLESAYPMQSLEVFERLRGADHATLVEAFSDRGFRSSFREQLATPRQGKIFYGEWDRVEIADTARERNAALCGRSVAAVAAERGADPVDLFFDLALEEDLATAYTAKLLNANEERVEPLLHHPAGVLALSDAGAHLSLLCDAGFGMQLLGHWVRERGSLSLEDAVRKLTSANADLYGIRDRGRIAPGAWADLMLFDPDTIAQSANRRVRDLPGGASRLTREASGLAGVWVNGVRVFDGERLVPLEAGPGHVLRDAG